MASRLWNQISSIKYITHGTFKTPSSLCDISQTTLINIPKTTPTLLASQDSGHRNFSETRESPFLVDDQEQLGRFVRTAPDPPRDPNDNLLVLRRELRERVQYGHRHVSKQAHDHYMRSRGIATGYKLRDGMDIVPDQAKIAAMKRAYARKMSVQRFQPHSLVPFCSKNADKFEREDIRPRKIVYRFTRFQPDYSWMTVDEARFEDDGTKLVTKGPDTSSIQSETHSQTSVTDSVTSRNTVTSQDTVDTVGSKESAYGPEDTARAKVGGYNFTRLSTNTKRHFSTFSRKIRAPNTGLAEIPLLQQPIRTLIDPSCKPPKCAPKTRAKPKPFSCPIVRKPLCTEYHGKEVAKKKTYKFKGDYWDKCECCPEMLPCDEEVCVVKYHFPCICENYPGMCPIDCPPPCEPPPPPPVPLCRPRKQPRYQKHPECVRPVCFKDELPCVKKTLPPLPPGTCPCKEPFIPRRLPPLKLCKKHVYQPTPVCEDPTCPVHCQLEEPKCLPPIIPGDCPCEEKVYTEAPPLCRLNLSAYQKQKECVPKKCEELEPEKCIVRKRLPPIKSDCFCVEPRPLKPVPLVRLPPICVCPPPLDPKCMPEGCPERQDEVCRWEYPVKKLKNYWCPNCKMPAKKREWCPPEEWNINKAKKRCMSTLAVRHFSTLSGGPRSQANVHLRPLSSTSGQLVPIIQGRQFHTTRTLPYYRSTKKTRKCRPKVECPKYETVCCDEPARIACIHEVKTCCRARKSPYPAFSECSGEVAKYMSCECGHWHEYLQPSQQVSTQNAAILQHTVPKFKLIDPLLEEHCVLHDLCRPYGYTYTCENFHEGEEPPIKQYECFSPHRLPCCERDQICDFKRRPLERKCDGHIKGIEYYRCECACKQEKDHCTPKERHKMQSIYSKIRADKKNKRYYSTMAAFAATRAAPIDDGQLLTHGNANCMSVRSKHRSHRKKGKKGKKGKAKKCKDQCQLCPTNSSKTRKGKGTRAGGSKDTWPECPCPTPKKGKCGEGFGPARQLEALKRKEEKPVLPALQRLLQTHFKKTIECTGGSKARKRALMEQAKCAAKAVGMKLVRDAACCKPRDTCDLGGTGGKRKGSHLDECKRPKNVCDACDPRWETDQCRGHNWIAPCCIMPHAMTVDELQSRQPSCCRTPIPICNRKCIRTRSECKKVLPPPCCVTESPYPAFSDAHPPFKRLIKTESMVQQDNVDIYTRRMGEMMKKLNKIVPKKHYSTSAGNLDLLKKTMLEKVLNYLADCKESGQKGLHEPVACKCKDCYQRNGFRHIRPDLSRNIKTALPRDSSDHQISNIPEVLFGQDDIFKEVDKENLISLAPKEMTPIDKLKCMLFNKATRPEDNVMMKMPDGFEMFASCEGAKTGAQVASCSTRSYSVSKIDAKAPEPRDEQPLPRLEPEYIKKTVAPKEVTLNGPEDLFYLSNGNAFDLRPKVGPVNKVMAFASPVCTHIMLDSGEMLSEQEYHLMSTIMPMKNRIYLPYGLSHEEYLALEEQTTKQVQDELQALSV